MGSTSGGDSSGDRGEVGKYGRESMDAMAQGTGVTDSQGNPVGFGPGNSGSVGYGGTHATQQAAANAAGMQSTHGNVSPAQSMSMVGDTSLAGMTQAQAQRNVTTRNVPQAQGPQHGITASTAATSFNNPLSPIGSYLSRNITPQRMVGSLIGSLALGPIGGLLGGIIGGTYGDDQPGFFGNVAEGLQTDFGNILGNPVSVFGGTTQDDVGITNLGVNEFGNETFSMPSPSALLGTQHYGTMPNVQAAPIGVVSNPTNAVDAFGNTVSSGITGFDPIGVSSLGTADTDTPFSGQFGFDTAGPINMTGVNLANLAQN